MENRAEFIKGDTTFTVEEQTDHTYFSVNKPVLGVTIVVLLVALIIVYKLKQKARY